MKTLIVGIVFNLTIPELIPFLKSVRKHYTGNVCIVTPETDSSILTLYKTYNIDVYHANIDNDRNIAFKQRLYIINELLKTQYADVDRVFFTDIRDVYFFGDIFSYTTPAEITFFSEPYLIGDCSINSRWYEMTYGADKLADISNETIICNGTILATKQGMLDYTDCMIKELDNVTYVIDQPITNHIVYSDRLVNCEIQDHGLGPIGTFAHDKHMEYCKFVGDKLYNVINGKEVLVVHQYDRCSILQSNILNWCLK